MYLAIVTIFTISAKFAGCSSSCWKCVDENRWDDCNDYTQVQCEGDQTMCGYVYTKQGSLENYRRDCFSKDFCEKKPLCSSPGLTKCSVQCCDTDRCNDGSPSNATRSSLSLLLLVITTCLFRFLTMS